ncbi:hypothetical protein Sste5346_005146 [Sporothrix stenoceras]|uniref:F-box domain-containing protein n=1 Tax=Sporothrix stenoceras TaxID=5173 RepID=A0ABR3Z4W6_9PEZI
MDPPPSNDCFPLPGELIDAILGFLAPQDLARVGQVSRTMRTHAMADRFWVGFIQQNLPARVHKHLSPGTAVPLPKHVRSYYHLYVAHEARWFLPRYKIWLCGHDMVGKIVVARYDPRRGCIEGYRMLAVTRSTTYYSWPPDPNVVMHAFHPEVLLHMDRPILKLEARPPPANDEAERETPASSGSISSGRTGPRIILYQPPAPLSFGQYMQNKAADADAESKEAADASSSTTPLPPVCPRIRPVFMDMDGDNALLSQQRDEPAPANNLGIVDANTLNPRTPASASSSSFVSNTQLRRQFVYARPLGGNAARGGGTFTQRGESAGGVGDDDRNDEDSPPPANDNLPPAEEDALELDLPPGRRPSPSSPLPFPLYTVWPPPAIPSDHRVRGTGISANHYPRGAIGQPRLRSEISDRAFHMRTWMGMGGAAGIGALPGGSSTMTFDALETYATIDPVHYTPTDDKIFRGIWVGDYSTHGCEFLLVHQPEDLSETPFDPESVPRLEGETDEAHALRVRDARVYRGRLEAIKLTGDPNVPRGERSFVVTDLGEAGLDFVVHEEPFAGVRVVKSEGHIAGTGFRNDRYVESRLLLISENRLAQYWVGFGHISFFERVDIDKFVDAME